MDITWVEKAGAFAIEMEIKTEGKCKAALRASFDRRAGRRRGLFRGGRGGLRRLLLDGQGRIPINDHDHAQVPPSVCYVNFLTSS